MKYSTPLIALILAALIINQQTGLILPCPQGTTRTLCDQNTSLTQTCNGWNWQTTATKKQDGKTCEQGTLIDTPLTLQSPTTKKYCINEHSTLTIYYPGDKTYTTYKTLCPTQTYCQNGQCTPQPPTCGDHTCQNNENSTNCYDDCSALASWDRYYESIPENIRQEYLYCGGVYTCNTTQIQQAIQEIETTYHPKTPKEFINSASKWVYSKISYRLDGGTSQCGTTATQLLQDAYNNPQGQTTGNCVDYSLVLATILKTKKIPASTAGVCLSHQSSWQCTEYALQQNIPSTPPAPMGFIDGRLAAEGGQVLAHSVVAVWDPVSGGMVVSDPTANGLGISSACVGYSGFLTVGGTSSQPAQTCYISAYSQLDACRSF